MKTKMLLVEVPGDMNGCLKCPAEHKCWERYPITDAPLRQQRDCPIYNAKEAVEFKEMLPGYKTIRQFTDKGYYEDKLTHNGKPVKLLAVEI